MRFLRLAQQRQASNYKLDRRLVVATLNCAERKTVAELCGGDTRNALADLLPRGADVYALGVQECQCWSELRQAVLAHLGDEFVALGSVRPYISVGDLRLDPGLVVWPRVHVERRDPEGDDEHEKEAAGVAN